MENNIKVVKIIDSYSIVINVGSDKDFKLGDELEIFEKGEVVIDPDTGESLGTLDYIKARVKITTILPKMSICKDIRQVNNMAKALANFSTFNIKEAQTLNVDSLDISGGFENVDKKIKIGDFVRKSS